MNKESIPLCSREHQFQELYKCAMQNFEACITTRSKKDITLPCVSSGPGTGKTRAGMEFARYLREKEPDMHIEYVYIDFSSGDFIGIQPYSSMSCLSMVALLVLNKMLNPGLGLTKFLELMQKACAVDFSRFTLQNAIEYLRTELLHLKADKKFIIVIQIDEFQNAISNEDAEKLLTGSKDKIWLRRFLIELLRDIMNLDLNTLPFFLPTGVMDLNYYGIFPATEYVVKLVVMDPLSEQDCMQVVQEKLTTKFQMKVQGNALLQRVVRAVEGLPRALELLLRVMDVHIKSHHCKTVEDINFNTLFNELKQCIYTNYSDSFKRRKGIIQYLTLAIANHPVEKRTVLYSDASETETVGKMDSVGIVFLRATSDINVYIPYIPYIFLCLANQAFAMYPPNMFDFNSVIPPSSFETFIAKRLYYNLYTYATIYSGTVKLEYLIPGIMSSDSMTSIEFEVDKDTLGCFQTSSDNCLNKTVFEPTKGAVLVKGRSNPIDPINNVLEIGRNCTFCDVACFLETRNGERYAILTEQKVTNAATKLSAAEFDKEYNNAMQFGTSGEHSAKYTIVFAMITQRDVAISKQAPDNNSIFGMFGKHYDNAILVSHGNMESFLGYFFKAFVSIKE